MSADTMMVEMKLAGGVTKDFVTIYLQLLFMMHDKIITKTSLQLLAAHLRNKEKLLKWDQDSWFTDQEMLNLCSNERHAPPSPHRAQATYVYRAVYSFVRDNKELFYDAE